MMDFITIPAVLTVIGYFTYKLFELFACRKERMYMLEHAKEISVNTTVDRLLPATGSYTALKWGAFFLGVGLGIVVGYIVNICCAPYVMCNNIAGDQWQINQLMGVVYGGCTLLFGGLGLVLAFIVELKLKKQCKD